MVDRAINGLTVSVSDVSALLKANEAVVQVHLDSCDIEPASDKDPVSVGEQLLCLMVLTPLEWIIFEIKNCFAF